MSEVEVVQLTSDELKLLKAKLMQKPQVFALAEDLDFTSLLVSLGIAQEVGSMNDELSRLIFDSSGAAVPRDSLKGEVIRWREKFGVRVSSSVSEKLEIRLKGFRDFCHPMGENSEGSFAHLTIFPEIVAKIAAQQGVELVVVKAWALNSIFGGFEKKGGYYETNFWELENNDALTFAELLTEGRLALIGTHDLVAHVSGLNGDVWPALSQYAARVKRAIRAYIGEGPPSIPDLVLPYTAGVILDDLAQPPNSLSQSHLVMLEEVLTVLEAPRLRLSSTLLLKYPKAFEEVIGLSRSGLLNSDLARAAVARLVREIRAHTAKVA